MRIQPNLAYEIAHLCSYNMKMGASLITKFWSHPFYRSVFPYTASNVRAFGELLERTITASQAKPDWFIDFVLIKGRKVSVKLEYVHKLPFGDLLHFKKAKSPQGQPRVLIAAPKSGHYATLLRDSVERLLPEADVYITDWRNAREVPLSAGDFDIEDYVEYLGEWIEFLGPDTHVIGVCQPAPLVLASVARYEQLHKDRPLASLTLMAGPIDPGAAPTEVTQYADKVDIETLKRHALFAVGRAYEGYGRLVYPGAMQLSAFMAMNPARHFSNFMRQWQDLAMGRQDQVDRHNTFYDEYLAVMDMTGEFFLTTVERIFKNREIGRDAFTLRGEHVPISGIRKTPIFVVEGARDDISAPGQCKAALDITCNLPETLKRHHIEDDAGHFAVFSGSKWRNSIAPKVLQFMKDSETVFKDDVENRDKPLALPVH